MSPLLALGSIRLSGPPPSPLILRNIKLAQMCSFVFPDLSTGRKDVSEDDMTEKQAANIFKVRKGCEVLICEVPVEDFHGVSLRQCRGWMWNHFPITST